MAAHDFTARRLRAWWDVRGRVLRELRGDGLAPGPSGESKVSSFRESGSESVTERCGVDAW
jgi:hypothetical protein